MLTYVWAYSTPHLDPSVQSNGPLYHIPCFLLGSCSLRVDESSVIDDTSWGGSSGDQIRKERSFRNNLTRLSLAGLTGSDLDLKSNRDAVHWPQSGARSL